MFKFEGHFVLTICAPRGSGKSFFIKNWLEANHKNYDHIVIMCPSIKFNDDYYVLAKKHKKKMTLLSEVSNALVNELFDKQSKCQEAVVRRDRGDDLYDKAFDSSDNGGSLKPLYCPDTLLILDDCIDTGILSFRGSLDRIAERGRHIGITLFVSAQRQSAVSRGVRINSTYFMIFSPFSVGELEQFLMQFVFKNQRQQLQELLLQVFEEPYQFLLLDNQEQNIKRKLKVSNTDDLLRGVVRILNIVARKSPNYSGKSDLQDGLIDPPTENTSLDNVD